MKDSMVLQEDELCIDTLLQHLQLAFVDQGVLCNLLNWSALEVEACWWEQLTKVLQ